MYIHFYFVYVRRFLNQTVAFFGLFWHPLWSSTLGSRLVRLMVPPALGITFNSQTLLVDYS